MAKAKMGGRLAKRQRWILGRSGRVTVFSGAE